MLFVKSDYFLLGEIYYFQLSENQNESFSRLVFLLKVS